MPQHDRAPDPVPSPTAEPHRGRGRPRLAETDARILQAAAEILQERGVRRLTISAVAERSGVARATVYRRYPTRDALVGATGRAATTGRTISLTGDLARDYEAGAMITQRIIESPVFIGILPEMVRGLTSNPPELDFNLVGPSRPIIAREYAELAAEQGFDPELPPNLGYDLIGGALLGHLLANGRPASQEYATLVARAVLRALRRAPDDAS